MPASFIIESIWNNKDGVTGLVTLSGTPAGSLTFFACRTPDFSKAGPIAAAAAGAGGYTLGFVAPVLWWVWAQDSGGVTASMPVWIGLSDNVDLNLCGLWVRDTLWANKAAIELKMGFINAGETIKQIEYGSPAGIVDYPSILIVRPKVEPKYAFFPYGSEMDYSVEIFCLVVHQDKMSSINLASVMTASVIAVLRQPDYTTVILDSGLPLNVNINQGSADEEQVDENKWAASGSIVWSGNGLTQDGSLTWP